MSMNFRLPHVNGPFFQKDFYALPRFRTIYGGKVLTFRFLNIYASIWF